jgi:hypothetical protein
MNPLSAQLRDGGATGNPALHLSPKNCAICQRGLTVHQEARGVVCDDPECRRKSAVALDVRRRQEKAAAVKEAALKYRGEISLRLGVGDPVSLRLAIIPYYHQPVVKLSRQRRGEFRAHLAVVLQQAFAGKFDVAAVADLEAELWHHAQAESEAPVVGAACAVCTGFCCRGGGTRAYLDLGAVRSFMARHPGMRLREVLRAYLGKLPDATHQGSCVYHGPRGCGLPREMRSSVCNTFYCDGVKGLRNEIAAEGPKSVLLLAADEGEFLKSAVIEPDGKTADLMNPREEKEL